LHGNGSSNQYAMRAAVPNGTFAHGNLKEIWEMGKNEQMMMEWRNRLARETWSRRCRPALLLFSASSCLGCDQGRRHGRKCILATSTVIFSPRHLHLFPSRSIPHFAPLSLCFPSYAYFTILPLALHYYFLLLSSFYFQSFLTCTVGFYHSTL